MKLNLSVSRRYTKAPAIQPSADRQLEIVNYHLNNAGELFRRSANALQSLNFALELTSRPFLKKSMSNRVATDSERDIKIIQVGHLDLSTEVAMLLNKMPHAPLLIGSIGKMGYDWGLDVDKVPTLSNVDYIRQLLNTPR